MQRIRKAVTVMEKANKEYLINIFKELTTELPQDLIYREDGDSIELKSFASMTDSMPAFEAA
jgi:hypothetical protein